MTDKASTQAADGTAPASPPPSRRRRFARAVGLLDFRMHIADMVQGFWTSRQRWPLILIAAALIAVIGATAYAQVRLNAWNQPFYDALTRKNWNEFVRQLTVFAALASVLLCLNVAQTWLNNFARVTLRKGLVHDLMSEWMVPHRAFRLQASGSMGSNPDQRMQADALNLSELTTGLGIGLLQSTLLLLSFVGVLWELSDGMFFRVGGFTFNPPGYMVWCALAYAAIASTISWLVGRPLIALNSTRYAREADFRFELVRVNEEAAAVALHRGEAAELARLRARFNVVIAASRAIVSAVTRLTWVTAGYGWFTLVAPILVAAPSYFAGTMTFGELMMVVGAFNQVQQSLRWFVDNFSTIADWWATLLRVASFRRALRAMDGLGLVRDGAGAAPATDDSDAGGHPHIALVATGTPGYRMTGLRIATPNGTLSLGPEDLVLAPGERLLVTAPHGTGKTLFFRALAGLWPWGTGRVERPANGAVQFLPSRAYLPPGALAAALTYPDTPDSHAPDALAAALRDVGLERLVPQLGTVDRWDRVLGEGERQALGVARALLHRPDWLVADDAFDGMDASARARIEALLVARTPPLGVIASGLPGTGDTFFTRQVTLVLDPDGPVFTPASAPGDGTD